MKEFKHRSWNHLCWTFQSLSGMNKIYLNGNLQGSFTIDSEFIKKGILGSKETLEWAFVIGQEPDAPSPRGGFEEEQVFVGDITELNIWNYTLNDEQLKLKGICKDFEKGNVVSWDINNFVINEVSVEEMDIMEELCKTPHSLFVFADRIPWSQALSLCQAHGGNIFTPTSIDENIEMMEALKFSKEECADPVSSNLAWLGIQSKDYILYRINQNRSLTIQSFTNWKANTAPYFDTFDCGFIATDGTWDSDKACSSKVKLCTVCKIKGNPILILKGTCDESPLDWVYYSTKDSKNEIFYEGYKDSKIVKVNKTWRIKSGNISERILDIKIIGESNSKISPVGRNGWAVLNSACKHDKIVEKVYSISSCLVGKEFSCDSGECVKIVKRCDNNIDCSDGSDEENCDSIRIPSSYEKSTPPELKKQLREANPINTQVAILNIDTIDTSSMSVGLTIEITMTWKDPRLIFENLHSDGKKMDSFRIITKKEADKVWLPIPDIIHENAILGTVIEDNVSYLKSFAKSSPKPMTLEEHVEALLFEGSENDLVMNQRFKINYRCDFFLKNYPFDSQTCNFILLMKLKGNHSIKFAKMSPAIIYEGPTVLTEFLVSELSANTSLSEYETRFKYSIKLDRLYMQAISSTFFQSFLLSVIAYATLYINIEDFTNRFMGSLTSLLVLAALLSSINSTLPQTAYFKHIDFWFFFYIINIVAIIFVHIIIDIFINKERNCVTHISLPGNSRKHWDRNASKTRVWSRFINDTAKYLIPFLILLFTIIYFEMSIYLA